MTETLTNLIAIILAAGPARGPAVVAPEGISFYDWERLTQNGQPASL
jgi:hypothetical protein